MRVRRRIMLDIKYTNKELKEAIPELVSWLLKTAKKFGEEQIKFGNDKYIRILNGESYIDLGTGGCWTFSKRSKEELIYILTKYLCK